ncbi:hypothetical protein F511_38611 [Dorcoceras hygrometricum]|uniref:Retrotransposon gag domain-containing protein n=1 Tax=Dorcoceras hygrometricum TaxID=472368 RepID=A0A2Z7A1Z5_9LAMI|nr:hypothetical protein F511_38611 [Dorcoceras hygrometricum]
MSRNNSEDSDGASDSRTKEQHQSEDSNLFIPKYSRLDFPTYDGSIDPLSWISRCEHFFRHQCTPEDQRVGLASSHLQGDAQIWFLKLERDRPNLTWESSCTPVT